MISTGAVPVGIASASARIGARGQDEDHFKVLRPGARGREVTPESWRGSELKSNEDITGWKCFLGVIVVRVPSLLASPVCGHGPKAFRNISSKVGGITLRTFGHSERPCPLEPVQSTNLLP